MNCARCGAALGDADLQSPNCRYCGALHPHMARAAEKVEVVKQLLAPGPGGMPVAMAAMLGVHGSPPPGGAPGVHAAVVMVNGVPVHQGAGPPLAGGPVVSYGAPGNYGNPYAMQAFGQQANQAMRQGARLMLWISVAVAVSMVLVVAIVLVFVLS